MKAKACDMTFFKTFHVFDALRARTRKRVRC